MWLAMEIVALAKLPLVVKHQLFVLDCSGQFSNTVNNGIGVSSPGDSGPAMGSPAAMHQLRAILLIVHLRCRHLL